MKDSEVLPLKDWQELTQWTRGEPLVVERVRIPSQGVAIEGAFELPELARLGLEDQVFIVAFVRSHGSIKAMEATFGVSYPTIKARLNRIAERLSFVDVSPRPSSTEILEQLKAGKISVQDAIEEMEKNK